MRNLNLQFFSEETQGDPQPNNGGDKTFTQEDVNRIVSERLAKEKAKYEATSQATTQAKEEELSRREQELVVRELKATAKETLTSKKLPLELLEVINFNSEEDMNKSIDILTKTYGSNSRVVTHYSPAGGESVHTDPIRGAFNLPE